MKKGLINSLYEQAHVVYEIPYEASVVEPGHIAISKQKVWDRYLFAELIVRECARQVKDDDNAYDILKHFGVEE